MAGTEFDRYSKFRNDNAIELVPFVEIPKSTNDYYFEYKKGVTRLDVVSNEYYGDPNYGWLILQANPEVGSLEFNIPDKTVLRIPFPLEYAISAYKSGVDSYKKLYKK